MINPAFSPDGRSLYYAAADSWSGPFHIFRLSLRGRAVTQLTAGAGNDQEAVISPNGRTVVFLRATRTRPYSMGGTAWDDYRVCSMAPDGSHLAVMTKGSYFSLSGLSFSPGGKSVLVLGVPHEGAAFPHCIVDHTYQFPLHTEAAPAVVDFSPATTTAGDIRFSRDGQYAVFTSSQPGKYDCDLYRKDVAGDGTPVPLHVNRFSTQNHSARLTPAGASILYLQGDFTYNLPVQLWEVAVDGSHPRRVADQTLFLDPLHWKP